MFGRRSYNVAPDIIDAGQGGGGGGIVNNGLPLGVIVPYGGQIAPVAPYFLPEDWLLCDGAEYRNDTIYTNLYNLIGFTFGVNPSTTTQDVGAYSYGATANTITFTTAVANAFIKVGTIVRPSAFTLTTGEDINGTYILITIAPAIGGTGTITGTFVQPIAGTGSGNATGFPFVSRASFAVPNMVSKFPLGASYGGSPVPTTTGGSATTTITADNLPQHNHGIDNGLGYSASGLGLGQPGAGNFVRQNFVVDRTLASTTYLNDNSTLATNSAISTLNPYLCLYYIIHAKN
jgi:microcystin-dependent protein